MLGILVAVITVIAVSRIYKWATTKNLRKPPRVPGLPFLGNILQVRPPAIHHGLSECAKKYGDIYKINLMGHEIVVLTSSKLIREACLEKGQDFSDRINSTYLLNAATYDGNNVAFGPYTKGLSLFRKTVHASIKTYGEEGTQIQELIQNELEALVDDYERTEGKAVNPQPDLRAALTNIIACLLIGRSIEKNSNEARSLNKMVSEMVFIATPGYGAELDIFPFLRWMPMKSTKCLRRFISARDAVLGPMYEEAKASFDPKCMRGFVDMLIQAQQCHLDSDGTSILNEQNILGSMTSLFIAGVLTTFSTVSSLMLICLHRPDVQEKLQNEIDRVIGQHNRPGLHHRQEMHYLNATFLEVLRYVSVGALVPRGVTRDTVVGGYDIENGTRVLMNIWEANHNSDWKEPWEFHPERFLDEKGKLLPHDHPTRVRLIPFGLGLRSCVGETFARNRVFLFIATLWQRFSFLPIEGEAIPSCDPRDFQTTAAVVPRSFHCKIMKRN